MQENCEKTLWICTNHRLSPKQPSCAARGSKDLLTTLKEKGLNIKVEESPCMGRCQEGPNARLAPGGPWFQQLSTDNTESLNNLMTAIEDFIKY